MTSLLNALLAVSFLTLGVLLVQILISARRYQMSQATSQKITNLDDIPTVSLCIPARNETHALADCLSAAIATDYPKLEIIVLDDCSQDKTSQIIRGFAQDGVRFIKGEVPSDGWLGKNNAYKALVDQAKGDYLVFMSVDTRIGVESISQLIGYMRLKKLSMASVLPRREDNFSISTILAPLRYFWQIATPLRFNTPVATSLWAIRADRIGDQLQAYKSNIDIENRLASHFVLRDVYHFLIANSVMQVSYKKRWQSQVDTSIRLWYPTVRKRYLAGLAVITVHFALFILPVIVLIGAILGIGSSSGYISVTHVLALAVCFMTSLVYVMYFRYIKKVDTAKDAAILVLAAFVMPVLAIQEITLIITSFYQYKRGRVDWKGRNVCYPVLKRY